MSSLLLRHCPPPLHTIVFTEGITKTRRGPKHSLSTFREKACFSVFKVETRSERKHYFQHTVTIPTLNGNVISKVPQFKVQLFHFNLLKLFPIFE